MWLFFVYCNVSGGDTKSGALSFGLYWCRVLLIPFSTKLRYRGAWNKRCRKLPGVHSASNWSLKMITNGRGISVEILKFGVKICKKHSFFVFFSTNWSKI